MVLATNKKETVSIWQTFFFISKNICINLATKNQFGINLASIWPPMRRERNKDLVLCEFSSTIYPRDARELGGFAVCPRFQMFLFWGVQYIVYDDYIYIFHIGTCPFIVTFYLFTGTGRSQIESNPIIGTRWEVTIFSAYNALSFGKATILLRLCELDNHPKHVCYLHALNVWIVYLDWAINGHMQGEM